MIPMARLDAALGESSATWIYDKGVSKRCGWGGPKIGEALGKMNNGGKKDQRKIAVPRRTAEDCTTTLDVTR